MMSDQLISSDMTLGIEIILTLSVRVSLFSGRRVSFTLPSESDCSIGLLGMLDSKLPR